MPNDGLAYGVGKWILDEGAGLVAMPQVCLNNWGGQSRPDSLFRTAPYSFEDEHPPGDFKRNHLIDLVITTGAQGLGMHWIYSRSLHRRETIAGLADNFIAHLRRLAVQRPESTLQPDRLLA
jgi:hypothetical protein